MAENTKIEWADHTFNPWTGCTKVSPACDHCYAEGWAKRSGHVKWGSGQPRRRTSDANWRMPIKWNREAERTGVRPRVFCASLADVFDNEVDPAWRADLFKLIADTQNLNWLLLTKRVGNVMKMANEVADMPRLGSHTGHLIAHQWRNGSPPKNVWLGATVVNQEEADRDIPKLLDVPAAKRFLSMEPLLGPVDLRALQYGEGEIDALKPDQWEAVIAAWRDTTPEWVEDFEDWFGVTLDDGLSGPMHAALDWVIIGGESGPGARPMSPDWARSIRDQCAAAGVALFVKQMGGSRDKRGELFDLPDDLRIREVPHANS